MCKDTTTQHADIDQVIERLIASLMNEQPTEEELQAFEALRYEPQGTPRGGAFSSWPIALHSRGDGRPHTRGDDASLRAPLKRRLGRGMPGRLA